MNAPRAAALGPRVPFIDGNKRVGLAGCLTFLALNGDWVQASEDELVALVLGTVSGERSKADVAVFLRAASGPIR